VVKGTLFHKSYWLRTSGREFRVYGYFKGGELFAGFPIVCGTSRLSIKRAYYPNLTPYLGVIFWDEKRSYYILGGHDPKESHHSASAIAMWEAIKFTKEELGLDQFDFEGSMMQPVEQFFRKFGGKLTPYYTVSWAKPSVKLLRVATSIVGKGLGKIGLRKAGE
jgi:hypothetical protein